MRALGKTRIRTDKPNKHGEASHVFRQFAWNLAGTLAKDQPPRRGGGTGRTEGTR